MAGTYQSLESYKDKCTTLQEQNDTLKIEAKDNYNKYLEENKKAITMANMAGMWKIATYVMTGIAAISIIIAIL
jgi:hypothetical protein